VALFIRLTILVAVVLVALTIAGFLLIHVVLPAAIIAAIIIGVIAAIGFFRRMGRPDSIVRR